MIKNHADWEVPDIPKPIPMIDIDKIEVNVVGSFFDNLDEPI